MVIASERAAEEPKRLIARVTSFVGDQEVALSAIGYAELVHGLHRAASSSRHAVRSDFLRDLISELTIYPFSTAAAEITGRVDAEQKALGTFIPFPDLLIGATALSLGFSVLTTNVRHFRLIPSLKVIPFKGTMSHSQSRSL